MADQTINVTDLFSLTETASYPYYLSVSESFSVVDNVLLYKGVSPYEYPYRALPYRSHMYVTFPGETDQERAG